MFPYVLVIHRFIIIIGLQAKVRVAWIDVLTDSEKLHYVLHSIGNVLFIVGSQVLLHIVVYEVNALQRRGYGGDALIRYIDWKFKRGSQGSTSSKVQIVTCLWLTQRLNRLADFLLLEILVLEELDVVSDACNRLPDKNRY